jgi:hypothetical protein
MQNLKKNANNMQNTQNYMTDMHNCNTRSYAKYAKKMQNMHSHFADGAVSLKHWPQDRGFSSPRPFPS